MGIEYKLSFTGATPSDLDKILRSLPSFDKILPAYDSYEFRSAGNSKTDMPDAEAKIETSGLYFCDYGGQGKVILSTLLSILSTRYGNVEASDYEL
jgi:hypothetical protein